MASSSLCATALRGSSLATLAPSPLAAAWAPLIQRLERVTGGAARFSSSSSGGSSSAQALPPATGGSNEPDAFTAALQRKTEEELRQMALKQAQSQEAEADASAADQGQADTTQPPHGRREIGGYKGPEPTRYSRSGASDWEIKGRCTDF